ncbi:2'-5' RNA ligase [Evansella vedderi]|uniref:RNA 2',3'-cyclic phosphodiesterase n=1 Tax=Evansella vedderi TaxID=38282 RepID=A0ABT9ZUT0_9BACI|nr:RNA 2',3'-cyclic phosphodiesterase [Evansella vedderi]MDQ0254974.1 2'-5' RNA ligase [Evansella vedderi]
MQRGHHFIGISLPSFIKKELSYLQEELQVNNYYKKITGEEDFHITLLFLGGWEHGNKVQVWEGLKESLQKIAPFTLTLNNIDFFGDKRKPRVLWTGIHWEERLLSLHQEIIKVAVNHGFLLENKPFRPHITLGKTLRSNSPFSIKEVEVPPLKWEVDHVNMFLIKPGKSPMYESISKISLSR